MDQRNDVTIIGAGPAGIAAAIYLKRTGLHPILLEKNEPGGLLRHAFLVENYPGFPRGVTGIKLAELFVKHLYKVGISITKSETNHVTRKKCSFTIETNQDRFVSPALIIASGTSPRTLGIKVPGSLEGTRLFYDPFSIPLKVNRKKRRILVIGGGDIAFDYTLTLLNWGHEVSTICRSEPTCLGLLLKRVQKKGATIHTRCIPEEIAKHPLGISFNCRQDRQVKEFTADFILVACGREPTTSFLAPSLKKCFENTSGFPQTCIPGLYVAGDVVRGIYRQTGVAVGDGIRAAMMTERYLKDGLVRR
jgi:thioredoxin reductase (NADPH)